MLRFKRNTQLGPQQMIRAEEVAEIRLFMEHKQMCFLAKGASEDWFWGVSQAAALHYFQ